MDEFEVRREDELKAFNYANPSGYRKRDARREAMSPRYRRDLTRSRRASRKDLRETLTPPLLASPRRSSRFRACRRSSRFWATAGRRLQLSPSCAKDIDDLKDRYRADITAIRDESTRTLDAIKWIVGLLVASNVGMGYSRSQKAKAFHKKPPGVSQLNPNAAREEKIVPAVRRPRRS